MLVLRGDEAYSALRKSIKRKSFRYPTKDETRYSDNRLFPTVEPAFKLTPGEKIFTIGSCFAREIEKNLDWLGFDVPMLRYMCLAEEFQWPGPHLLNEYNAGTMFQRINNAYDCFEYVPSAGVEQCEGGYYDLFLHINQRPVSLERLHERRAEIRKTYDEIKTAETVVITLGLTESWYDADTKCYLNKAPSRKSVLEQPDRFYFHRMDLDDVVPLISRSIDAINRHSRKNILLTVSPVPIEATFTSQDAIIANYYSKSTLRVAAHYIKDKFENVEYFPSFEIAMSGGSYSFASDNVHVEYGTVDAIMKFLVRSYVTQAEPSDAENHVYTNIDAEIDQRSGT